MQRGRAQEVYFNCNERFTAGHRCRKSQLLILEGEGVEEAGTDEVEISLHTLMGWPTARTMKDPTSI